MIPIHELLNRIRWDRKFARGHFEIGYLDHKQDHIIRVAFENIEFETDDHYFIHVTDDEQHAHNIPLHRIKEVYKDGTLIWHRTH